MAVDILTTLAELLCWENTQCMQLFTQYAYKPLEGLIYLVFFPTVFIILLIYLIVNRITARKGLNFLLGIAFYAFIIMQGWYGLVAQFGTAWYMLIIILLGVWAVFRTFFPQRGEGGGVRQRITTFSKFGGELGKRAWSRMSGQEKDLAKRIERRLHALEKMDPKDYSFGKIVADAQADLSELRRMASVYNLPIADEDRRKLASWFTEIMKKKEKE